MSTSPAIDALVIGAGGGIASALVDRILASDERNRVVAISRSRQEATHRHGDRLQTLQSDYSERSMVAIVSTLMQDAWRFDRIYICNGMLHGPDLYPEKRLEDVSLDSLQAVMSVNAFIPICWLKYLKPLLQQRHPCTVSVISARVGSIEDNRLGGWYGYRASKAALNMLLKTAAIEYRRFSTDLRFLVFHPGTTDTALSKPFQKGVPQEKLFTPGFVAERLFQISAGLPEEPVINYLDWDGKPIPW